MIPTFVMAAALAVGAYEPVPQLPLPEPMPEVHKVPGPAFQIPCKVQAADLIGVVQLWVSADRGKKWELYEEITPDKSAFTFIAKKPGEYWFAPRIKKKDGTLLPADTAELVATQRVAVANGNDIPEPTGRPTRAPTSTQIVAELDEELTRVELDLIRKEIKKLSEMKDLTPDAEEKFDRLRMRLRDLRDRLRPDRDRSPTATLPTAPSWVDAPAPVIRPPRIDNDRIPPSAVPTDPLVIPSAPMPIPARPVAPMPRVPER